MDSWTKSRHRLPFALFWKLIGTTVGQQQQHGQLDEITSSAAFRAFLETHRDDGGAAAAAWTVGRNHVIGCLSRFSGNSSGRRWGSSSSMDSWTKSRHRLPFALFWKLIGTTVG